MASNKTIFNWQLYLGVVFVVTGALFLADQLLDLQLMRVFWPLLVVLFGVTFFIGMIVAGKNGAGLAVPGSIITTLGLLLFIQNSFDLWVTWAYAWALLISASGLGMLIMNFYLKRVGLRRVAGLVIGIGLTLFVLFGVLFEIIFDITGTDIESGLFLGGGLVLLGFFVIFSRPLFAKASKRHSERKSEPGGVVDVPFEDVEKMPVPDADAFQPLTNDAEFSGLHFKSAGEVFIAQGEVCGLKIEGDADLLNNLKTEVHEDILFITYLAEAVDWNSLKWIDGEHRIRYFVTLKALKQVDLAGAGIIRAENLAGENLVINHFGAGSMTLKGLSYSVLHVDLSGLGEIRLEGEVGYQSVDLSGAGSYDAEKLQSQKADISLSGPGSARLWVDTALHADVSGAGSIKYKGDPSLEKTSSGLGKINPL